MTTPPPWNGQNPPQPSGWDKPTPPPTPPTPPQPGWNPPPTPPPTPPPGWNPPTPPPMPPQQQYLPPQPPPGMYGTPGMPGMSGMQPMLQLPADTLVTIGDIVCTQHEVITPSGSRPIGQVTWSFTDLSRSNRVIPTWAIVCTIVFTLLLCGLGLLFLLAKEERTEGSVQIVVQGPGMLHQLQLPVYSVMQVQDFNARVGYARSLTAAAAAAM
ncbi:hypothetical protein [Streptacidiphilus cavernicola]|uniref:Uncharacterized protein n=1 Tax=Streptacidiphilus cavernicola TaxID=3342716 RepID=A0ABV6VV65_9ACTN